MHDQCDSACHALVVVAQLSSWRRTKFNIIVEVSYDVRGNVCES
jgi:hypothetical protein